MDEIMRKFKESMESLNDKDLEIVSNNLHKNNMRIEKEVRFSLTEPHHRSDRSYTSIRVS